MKEYFKAERVSENVWWVGAIDWNVRNFHGYETSRGTTYNAFLIMDEKITLVDTVKAPFVNELLARVASVIDPAKIDIIISNHAEPDHSGGLPAVIAATQPEKVIASVTGVKTLRAYYGEDLAIDAVKTGDTLSLGKGTLSFVDTKMLHWPDSMISYYDRDKVLFSQDALGMHLANSSLWADLLDPSILDYEARKYFANILNFQAPKVLALLDSLPSLGLDIGIIAPDHGPLWRKDLETIIGIYHRAAEQQPKRKALIAYSTMWGATARCANALADGLRSQGVTVVVTDLSVSDRSAVMTEVGDAGIIAFGAPTMNNQMYPAMADVLTYLKGLKPKNKIGFAFGAYGWSGEGAKNIAAELDAMGAQQPVELRQVKYMPTTADLEGFFACGVELAKALG
ncbi:MAG: FprA family A-type flavoprotein [Lentisphaeria bacterium]|nr:FprA family A-type flavoprotein [Lentisphaeria bacterium]